MFFLKKPHAIPGLAIVILDKLSVFILEHGPARIVGEVAIRHKASQRLSCVGHTSLQPRRPLSLAGLADDEEPVDEL
jgi:hypothetical protein